MNIKDYVHRLCIQCKDIYAIKYGFDYVFGLVFVICSIYLLINLFTGDLSILSNPTIQIFLVFFVLMFIAGVFLLHGHKKKLQNCTICNSNKTLIPLDTPEALELIKKYDLKIPEQEEKKFPWQA